MGEGLKQWLHTELTSDILVSSRTFKVTQVTQVFFNILTTPAPTNTYTLKMFEKQISKNSQ